MEFYRPGAALLERRGKHGTCGLGAFTQDISVAVPRDPIFPHVPCLPTLFPSRRPERAAPDFREALYEISSPNIDHRIDCSIAGRAGAESTCGGRVARESAQARRKGNAPREFQRGRENLSQPA